MTRYYSSKKSTIEDYSKTLNIFYFKRDRFLEKGMKNMTGTVSWSINGKPNGNIGVEIRRTEFDGTLRVHFTQTDRDSGEKKDFDYIIQLTTTGCHI